MPKKLSSSEYNDPDRRKHLNTKMLMYALGYGGDPKLIARYNGWRSVKVMQKYLHGRRKLHKMSAFIRMYGIPRPIVFEGEQDTLNWTNLDFRKLEERVLAFHGEG